MNKDSLWVVLAMPLGALLLAAFTQVWGLRQQRWLANRDDERAREQAERENQRWQSQQRSDQLARVHEHHRMALVNFHVSCDSLERYLDAYWNGEVQGHDPADDPKAELTDQIRALAVVKIYATPQTIAAAEAVLAAFGRWISPHEDDSKDFNDQRWAAWRELESSRARYLAQLRSDLGVDPASH